MKNKSLRCLTQGAAIAAMYIAINYAQNALFPGSTNAAIQFRVAEALCMLACFTPAAIPGLTVGCFFANLISVGWLPLDLVIGTFATLLAAFCMYGLRRRKILTLPVVSALMPVFFNGILVAFEISLFTPDHPFFFWVAGTVALGELAVLFILGLPLYKAVEKIPALRKLIG